MTNDNESNPPEAPAELVLVPEIVPAPAGSDSTGTAQPEPPAAPEPQFMSEEQFRAFKVVDIIGNGDPNSTVVLSSEEGVPLTHITAMTFIFAVRPMAVKVEVAIGYKEPDEKGMKLLETIEVVYAVGRLMLCSNPRLVRMKHRGSKEWNLIAEFMDRLDNASNTYYAVMEAMRRMRSIRPEETRAEGESAVPEIKVEVADVQVDSSSQTQLES